jgi:hypothetical protein
MMASVEQEKPVATIRKIEITMACMGDACDIGTFCKGLADYDQDVDSADVTVFLQHFGRSPFNNPCPLDGPSPVPQTGQDACYDEDGVQRDCEGTREDDEYQSGVAWPNPRFTDKGNGTIQDNLTGLIWLRYANCIVTNYPEFDNDGTSGNGRVTWQHALDFVKGINDETYLLCGAGYTDWRLPNKKELFSLLRYNCLFVPCIPDTSGTGFWSPGDPFTNVELLYWSSTTYSQNSNTAFFFATDGIIQNNVKINYIGYVWPVRGSH